MKGMVSASNFPAFAGSRLRSVAASSSGLIALLTTTLLAQAAPVAVTNLVTDDQGVNAAKITDPGLVNGWGVSYGANTPFWVSSNGKGTSTIYQVTPGTNATAIVPLVVAVPGAGNPTGQVFNGENGFNKNLFLFVSEDGTISGWRGALGTTAETLQTASSSNLYKGAAITTIGGNNFLYAANFKSGAIDVLKGNPAAPDLTGKFLDPTLPSGYKPFNVQTLGEHIYVAYALPDPNNPTDELAGKGLGIVDEFDQQGGFQRRIATQGALDAPWGLAIAPTSFGALAGHLLVGNFGDGKINAFNLDNLNDPSTALTDATGKAISIDGLWALTPGNGTFAGSAQDIFFSAGPNDESHGLFGAIHAVPEPSTCALLGLGLAVLLLSGRRLRFRSVA
jgi:uncharacterized protein (TIGR03118 family)